MTVLNYSDVAAPIALIQSVDASTTTFRVSTSGGYPPAPFEFAIDLDVAPELCLCLRIVSPTEWIVQRGYDGSAPQPHSPRQNQIFLATSQQFWADANVHITQHLAAHTQYFPNHGEGHDNSFYHTVAGRKKLVSIYTDPEFNTLGVGQAAQASYVWRTRPDLITPGQPAPSHFGDTGFQGLSVTPANGLHLHAREDASEFSEGHLWPPGTLAIWGGATLPQGWLPADGRDVRTDLAPKCFEQWGFTCGSAIAWYPPPPEIGTSIVYQKGSYIDPDSQAILTLAIPYAVAPDLTHIALQLPADQPVWFKLPNLPDPGEGLTWIVKMDYGYVWEPRPSPPPPLPMVEFPFKVDQALPPVTFVDHYQGLPGFFDPGTDLGPNSVEEVTVVSAPHPAKEYPTNWTWGFDAVSGLPVIQGSDYIGPEQVVSGPIAVPVYPFGQSPPPGFFLLQPPQPAYVVGPPIILNEELVQLVGVRVDVYNGYGVAVTDYDWSSLASAPWVNASYPPADGNYLNGIAQVQDRNNKIAVTVSKCFMSYPSTYNGQSTTQDNIVTGSILVYFFVYT